MDKAHSMAESRAETNLEAVFFSGNTISFNKETYRLKKMQFKNLVLCFHKEMSEFTCCKISVDVFGLVVKDFV